MTFTDVDDIGLRAACELVQDVVVALTEQLADGDLTSVSKRELARTSCGRVPSAASARCGGRPGRADGSTAGAVGGRGRAVGAAEAP